MAITPNYDLDTDTSLGGSGASDTVIPSQKAIKTYVDNNTGGGGTATDVQINGTSITSNDVANIITNSAYNSSSNKIATMSDVPTVNNATLTIQKNGTTVNTFTANASSNVTANITVPTTASDINAADTDLSNLSTTGKTVIDGQWVFNDQSIISSQSLNGSTDLTKTVTLPNDGHLYEVLFSCSVVTSSSSGNNVYLFLASSLGGTRALVCAAITRTSSQMRAAGSIILPMQYGSNNLTIHRDSTYNGTASVDVRAYRRIGSNT